MGNINLQRYYDSIGHSGKSFFKGFYISVKQVKTSSPNGEKVI